MIRTECSQTILRSKYVYAILSALSTGAKSVRQLYSSGNNRSAVWKALKTVSVAQLTQHEDGMVRLGSAFSLEDGRLFFTINPFDFRLDKVLSSSWMTRILLVLRQNGAQYLRELNALLQRCTISSLQAALRPLEREHIVLSERQTGRRLLKLNSELITNQDDPVSNVPETEFHSAIKELKAILETEHHNFETVLVIGAVAHGLAHGSFPTPSIEVIGILPSNPLPHHLQSSLQGLVRAASVGSERTGASILCAISTSDLVHQQMWGCFERPDSWLSGAVIGVPLIGRSKPASLATLFSEMSNVLPPSVDHIHKWLKSGTIQKSNDTYAFTLKGVNRLRRISAPPRHETLRIEQRDVVFITYSK